MVDYASYLASDHWKGLRKQALERAEHRCQVCNGSTRIDVHHRTYERLGYERLEDLTVLCRGCHKLFHEQRTLDPAKAFAARRKAVCCFCGKRVESWLRTQDGRAHCASGCEGAERFLMDGLDRLKEREGKE
jgi:hypothetical protein